MPSPASTRLFQMLVTYDTQKLPVMENEIATGHATNMKDRVRDLHQLLKIVTRYIIVENAERYGLDPTHVAGTGASPNQRTATMSPQHFPASAVPALGAPPMLRTQNVMVGAEPSIGQTIVGAATPDPLPEQAEVVQIVTLKNGSTVVIPPIGYDAAPRTFGLGQPVDATFYLPKQDDGLPGV